MEAWEEVADGGENPMESLLLQSEELGKYLGPEESVKLLDAKNHVGNAEKKALTLREQINKLT